MCPIAKNNFSQPLKILITIPITLLSPDLMQCTYVIQPGSKEVTKDDVRLHGPK